MKITRREIICLDFNDESDILLLITAARLALTWKKEKGSYETPREWLKEECNWTDVDFSNLLTQIENIRGDF